MKFKSYPSNLFKSVAIETIYIVSSTIFMMHFIWYLYDTLLYLNGHLTRKIVAILFIYSTKNTLTNVLIGFQIPFYQSCNIPIINSTLNSSSAIFLFFRKKYPKKLVSRELLSAFHFLDTLYLSKKKYACTYHFKTEFNFFFPI